MNVVSVNHTPEQKRTALDCLQADLNVVIEQFRAEYGELPAVVVLGVLRLVEHDFIANEWQA